MAISTIIITTAGVTQSQGTDHGRVCPDHIGRKRSDTSTSTIIETGTGTMIEAEEGTIIETGIKGMIMMGDRHSMASIAE
jgi:hypothetical protein